MPLRTDFSDHANPLAFNQPNVPRQSDQAWVLAELPPLDRASYLCNVYLERMRWLATSITPEQLQGEVVPTIYGRASQNPAFDYSGPHALALLCNVLAIGALVDPLQLPFNDEAAKYGRLGATALAQQSVLDRPSILTVECLQHMFLFAAMGGGGTPVAERSMDEARGYLTVACLVSQIVSWSTLRRFVV